MNSAIDPSVFGSVVALTGIRHSGKSTAAAMFSARGAVVVNADDLARLAIEPGSLGFAKTVAEFGPEGLDSSGALNRSALAAIIYRNPERRAALEAIIHPIVRELAYNAFSSAVGANAPLIIYDCPLFFEGDLDQLGFRGVVVVTCDAAQVLPRIMVRDKVDLAEAERRLATQFSQDEKLKRATWILDNCGTLEELEVGVEKLFRELVVEN